MAEEYILKSDLVEWMYTWFDCDGKKDEKVVRKAIIDKLPTHSFESLDEAKIADIVFEHAPNGATNCMKTAQAICQHFKKAEGDYVFSSSVSSDIYGDSFIYLPEDVNNLEYKDVIVSLEIQVLDKKVK